MFQVYNTVINYFERLYTIVIIKYWLSSLRCTIYPYSSFILYIIVCTSYSPTSIYSSPPPFALLTGNH